MDGFYRARGRLVGFRCFWRAAAGTLQRYAAVAVFASSNRRTRFCVSVLLIGAARTMLPNQAMRLTNIENGPTNVR